MTAGKIIRDNPVVKDKRPIVVAKDRQCKGRDGKYYTDSNALRAANERYRREMGLVERPSREVR